MSTSISAASEVFGIPELLEIVLVYVSENPVNDPDVKMDTLSNLRFQTPAKALFILQRVNSAFQATIARNTTIQQRMLLAPIPQGQDDTHHYSTLDWFRDKIERNTRYDFSRHVRPYAKMPGFADHGGGIVITDRFIDRLSAPYPGLQDASWRKMKLHCIKDGKDLDIFLMNGGPNRRFTY